MADTKQIKTALISVFHKDGLDDLLAKLHAEGVKFLSTGGTQKFIESLGYECQTVESVTSLSIMSIRTAIILKIAAKLHFFFHICKFFCNFAAQNCF